MHTRGISRGNRIWLASEGGVEVVQKVYAPTAGLARLVLERLFRRKTGCTVRERLRTEREQLRVWSDAGFDVPRDVSELYPHLAHPNVTVLERIRGRLLGMMLRHGRLTRRQRDALLGRFGADLGRRNLEALRARDSRLVQEHGSVLHVFVTKEGRQVTFDLEHAYLPRRNVRPLVIAEIASCLRSLAKESDVATFTADLRAIIAHYPDRQLLRDVAAAYARPRGLWRRVFCAVDRRLSRSQKHLIGKYEALAILDRVLDGVPDGDLEVEGASRPELHAAPPAPPQYAERLIA